MAEAGKRFGIVTGRELESVRRRAEDLKFDVVRMGIDDKLPAVDAIAAELGITREAICYIGDDILDLRVIHAVGLGVAVADAAEEIRKAAKYTTSVRGGAVQCARRSKSSLKTPVGGMTSCDGTILPRENFVDRRIEFPANPRFGDPPNANPILYLDAYIVSRPGRGMCG